MHLPSTTPPRSRGRPVRLSGPSVAALAAFVLLAVIALPAVPGLARAQGASPAPVAGGDPFAQSQLAQVAPPAGGLQLTVSGFVDVGYIDISQSGPNGSNERLSWAYGNSQFHFFSETNTFTVNEVDLTLDAQKETGGRLYGARASIDFYPSRDAERYLAAGTPPAEFDVDQAFVFVEWTQAWKTRLVAGRAPGFVVLEQQEADAPDLRLIGHTYAFQAGGGYPYGLQVHTQPVTGLRLRFGLANGGMAAYSFAPGDNSASNQAVARDGDGTGTDIVNGRTIYANVDWVAFDQAAGLGTLRIGIATASAPELTTAGGAPHTYKFDNFYAGYRRGSLELRLEKAALDTAYDEVAQIGWVNADILSTQLSWYLGTDHLFTLRAESMDFVSDQGGGVTTSNSKNGLTWRYRIEDGIVLKVEGAQEVQSGPWWTPTAGELTTTVLAASWVYSF